MRQHEPFSGKKPNRNNMYSVYHKLLWCVARLLARCSDTLSRWEHGNERRTRGHKKARGTGSSGQRAAAEENEHYTHRQHRKKLERAGIVYKYLPRILSALVVSRTSLLTEILQSYATARSGATINTNYEMGTVFSWSSKVPFAFSFKVHGVVLLYMSWSTLHYW